MDLRFVSWAGYELKACDTTASGIGGYGSIQLEYGWQLIAVPIQYGYWDSSAHEHVHDDVTVAKFKNYILNQITDLYGTGIVEVANTYIGDNQFFWNYVVGNTPESNPNNFQLVYDDSGYSEISGLWIKIINPSAPYLITWGETP